MNTAFTILFYVLSFVLLALSFARDRGKTRRAVKKALAMMLGVLPHFLTILLITGAGLAVFGPAEIQALIGARSGLRGMMLSAVTGAAALVPVLAVFPVVSQLLDNGAGIAQMAVFISTLTTVGLVTLPLESRYLGIRAALLRNLLFFLFAFATSALLGVIL